MQACSSETAHLLVNESADILLDLLVLVPHHPTALLHLLWPTHLLKKR